MASSDWLALGGVIVSCLAFAVSFVAYRLQARSAQSDNEKELADQINAIQSQLAELSPVPQSADSMEALARTGNAAQQAQAMAAILKTSSVGRQPDLGQGLSPGDDGLDDDDWVRRRDNDCFASLKSVS
jgi:hypothetical protein